MIVRRALLLNRLALILNINYVLILLLNIKYVGTAQPHKGAHPVFRYAVYKDQTACTESV